MAIGSLLRAAARGVDEVADVVRASPLPTADELLNEAPMQRRAMPARPAVDRAVVPQGQTEALPDNLPDIDEDLPAMGSVGEVAPAQGDELAAFAIDDSLFTSAVPQEATGELNTAIDSAAVGTKAEGLKSDVMAYRDGNEIQVASDTTVDGENVIAGLSSKDNKHYTMSIGLNKALRGTGEGQATYQGTYAWAAANDKVIIPDEYGLSADNYVRKSAQVASTYLKAGKSSHVIPDPVLFSYSIKGIDTTGDVNGLSALDYGLVKYPGKEAKSFDEVKASTKTALEGTYPESKVTKDFDRFADTLAERYNKYYNPDVQDSPVVAQQRANNLLVANMASIVKSMLLPNGGKKSAISRKNKQLAVEFTSDYNISDPNKFNWEKLMTPVGEQGKLPFLEWLGKAAAENRVAKGSLPAIGAMIASQLADEEEQDGLE